MRKIYLLLVLLTLPSCAYLMGTDTHELTVTTSDGRPAYCTLKNKTGIWRGYTGKPIMINPKPNGNLRLSCVMNSKRASKLIRANAKKGYPDHVMVNMYVKKKAVSEDSAASPKDNDEETGSDLSGDDALEDQDSSQPLNILPDPPKDEEEEVIIIKHK